MRPAPRLTMIRPSVCSIDMTRAKVPPKTVEPFYQSAEWREARDTALKLAGGKCCRDGCRRGGRMFVDHIIERKDGGDLLAQSNLQVLCGHHHTKKTVEQRAVRTATRY